MNTPVGLECPGCGKAPAFALSEQAFCGNDNCGVMMWNPTKTLEEMAADIGQFSDVKRERNPGEPE